MEAVDENLPVPEGQPDGSSFNEAEWASLLVAADRAVPDDRLAEAFDCLKQALRIAKSLWPGGNETAETYIRLGDLSAALDMPDAALQMYGRGADILQAQPDGITPRLAHAVSNMGRLLALAGNKAKARELTVAADALNSKLGESPSTVIKLNLAIAAAEAAQPKAAEAAFAEALTVAERTRRSAPRLCAAAYDNSAAFLVSRDRSEEAEELLRRCLIFRQEDFGPSHPAYAEGLVNLARLLHEYNASDEAETLLWQATEVFRRNDGKPAADMLHATYFIARIAHELERPDDVKRLCQRIRGLGEGNETIAQAADAAALHVTARGMLAGPGRQDAEDLLRRALSGVKNLKGDLRSLAEDIEGDILCDLAGLLVEVNKAVEADRLMTRASELRQRPKWKIRGHVFSAP